VLSIPSASLAYNVTGTVYNVFEYPVDDFESMVGTFERVLLKFTVKDCDPSTGQLLDEDDQGYSDEYLLEDVDMSVADYIQRLAKNDFDGSWTELGAECEVEEVYALSAFKSIDEAIKNVICFMGMQPCDRTDRLTDAKNALHHTLKLVGLFRGDAEVLVIAKLAMSINQPEAGVTMKLQVRCEDQDISNFIASAVV
jgi:coatomer protein complex subunit gamma